MKTPKYRFLLGTHLQAVGNYVAGYYDKLTGQFVSGGTSLKCESVAIANAGVQGYLAADNTFLKESSYITLYEGNSFIGTVLLSSIMGTPYILPQGVTSIGITLDVTEMETDHPRPVYILREAESFYSKLSKKIGKESGQMFFREVLDTDLHFVGSEADIIQTYSVEDKFMVICERKDYATDTWNTYHSDTFGVTDCSFDLAAHTCTPKLTPLDNYSRVLARYSDEYDLIKLKPEICRIKTSLRPIIEIYERGSGVITRFLGGTYWETEVTPEDDAQALIDAHFSRVPLSEARGYLEAKIDEDWTTIIGLPSGIYEYDPTNNYYYLQDGDTLWTWGYATYFNLGFLALSRNGVPIQNSFGEPLLAWLPTSIDSPSDLPVPSDYENEYLISWYTDTAKTIGTVHYRYYDIWARVIGNGDSLFGVATFDIPNDDFAISSPSYKKCAPLGKEQGYFYLSDDVTVEPTEFGITEDPEKYYTRENLPIEGGLHGVRPMPIGKHEWGSFSFWFNYPDNYTLMEQESRYDYDLKDCFTLGAVIRALLAVIDPSITFVDGQECSQFFYSPYGLGVDMKGGYDWKIAITPKSNVLKGDYDQAAQKAPISFEELMTMLKDLYGLYWYIDSGRRLHIEHLVWFLNGGSYTVYQGNVQLNLADSNVKDAFNKKMTGYWQKAYEFSMSEAARRLELTYSEKGTEFFEGLSIDVLNSYLREASVNSKSIANFTADLDLMRVEPDRYSSDGFALLAYLDAVVPQPPYTPTGQKLIPVTGAIIVTEKDGWQRQAYINNLFASWLYCQHFYMYNLSGDLMKVNLKLESLPNAASLDSVHGLARLKKQKVRFPFDDDPDTIDLIQTDIGYGVPEDFEIDAESRTVSATLSFPVKDSAN